MDGKADNGSTRASRALDVGRAGSTSVASAESAATALPCRHVTPAVHTPAGANRRDVWLSMVAACLGVAVFAIEVKGLSVLYNDIANDLRGGRANVWVIAAYLIGGTATIPFIGDISQTFGRRTAFQLCIVVVLVGTILAGAARNIATMLVGRVLQGMAGSGLLLTMDHIISDLIPLRRRQLAYAVPTALFTLLSAVGPVIAGAMSPHWRWYFWWTLPIIVAAALSGFIGLQRHRTPATTVRQRLKRLDWSGSALVVGSLTSICYATAVGGSRYAWSSAHVLAPLVVGVAGLLSWPFYEHLLVYPTIPFAAFRTPSVYAGSAHNLLFNIPIGAGYQYLPLWFQTVLGRSALQSSVDVLANFIAFQLSLLAAALYVHKTGEYKIATTTFDAVHAVSLGVFSLLGSTSPTWAWVLASILLGLGQGTFFGLAHPFLLAHVPPALQGQMIIWIMLLQSVGQTIGVGVINAILQSRMRVELPSSVLQLVDQDAVNALRDVLARLPPAEAAVARAAAAKAYSLAWQVLVAFAGAAFLLSLVVKAVPLHTVTDEAWGLDLSGADRKDVEGADGKTVDEAEAKGA